MSSTIKKKLTALLSLLNTYANNRKEIYQSLFKLQDDSYVNIEKARELAKQVNVVQHSAE